MYLKYILLFLINGLHGFLLNVGSSIICIIMNISLSVIFRNIICIYNNKNTQMNLFGNWLCLGPCAERHPCVVISPCAVHLQFTSSSAVTRCDGRTFTETNGSIVSGKADRAVNQGPNTEQININQNSTAFSDRLCAKQQMQPAVSGLLSSRMHS